VPDGTSRSRAHGTRYLRADPAGSEGGSVCAGDHLPAGRYESLLTRSRGIRIGDISRDLLRAAAQLRAATGVKTPDSLHLVQL